MPNHIHNKLEFFGNPENVATIVSFVKNEKGEFDFNKIIPMPEDLSVNPHSGIENLVNDALNIPLHSNPLIAALEQSNRLRDREKGLDSLTEEEKQIYYKCIENYKNYGHTSWYTWRNENWGTKWNAYSQDLKRNTDNTFYYQTAWNHGKKAIERLALLFPYIHIKHSYACEYGNSQAGIDQYHNGWYKHTDLSKDKQDVKMFVEIAGGKPQDHGFDENYNSIDED